MQVARPNFFGKNSTLSSVSRSTSCKPNWIRLGVQSIFATITVASFILILIMAVKNPNPAPALRPTIPPRCHIYGCRVVCKEAPYFDRHEEDILFTVAEAETECTRVVLELNTPHFVNGTLPENWLSRMRTHIHQLAIIRGNLRNIPAGAFMSQFTGNIVILVLHELHIENWESNGLVGLSSLRTLNILNSRLENVHENVLRAIDDTLETLTITESGPWDPYIFTGARGFEKLTIVDFSHNDFDNILGPFSFVGLEETKILYLNGCKITAIRSGAFDHLLKIEVLYLNNNLLVTVPPGLFDTIVALDNPRPRINLQDNFWFCDCSVQDLRQLVRKEILLVESTCTYPTEMNSLSFSEFEHICVFNDTLAHTEYLANETINKASSTPSIYSDSDIFVNTFNCSAAISRSNHNYNDIRIMSPEPSSRCSSQQMQIIDTSVISDRVIYDVSRKKQNGTIWPQIYYFMITDKYSVVQIVTTDKHVSKRGLMWFQASCPQEIYCLEEIPNFLRVYNSDINARYTFCLMNLETARIDHEDCIGYDISVYEANNYVHRSIIVYLIVAMLFCLCFGAIMVYGLIRARPTLLKGSKRILFVKHKNVDALVLPPKVPIRNDLKTEVFDSKKDIFTLSPDQNLKASDLNRIKSVRSNKSGSPSYISAMQPTEDQLAEWRIRHHFNNNLTVSSMKSELSTLSSICGDTFYHSLNESDTTYESLK